MSAKAKIWVAYEKKGMLAPILKILRPLNCITVHYPLPVLKSQLTQETPDLVIILCDATKRFLKPDFFREIEEYDDNLPVIVVSAATDLEEVIRVMKHRIYDYLLFPPDEIRMKLSVENGFRMYQLTKRIFLLENRLGVESNLQNMIGPSAMMQTIFQTVRNVAKTDATCLITGESGTGKELVAKAIHALSPRKEGRFIDINCGAIPKELLENELFGHERGAYTSADKRYIGCCERADGGTLFLDEISEMEPNLQVKLLRFLQERHFQRVGGNEPIGVNVRIIAASNRNLEDLAKSGAFREDLFYRLNVVHIALPPLRERKEDIPLLAKHFLDKYNQKNEKIFMEFTPETMERLVQYSWPGNIRELENMIERGVVLHNDTLFKPQHLPEPIRALSQKSGVPAGSLMEQKKVLPLEIIERYAIEAALKFCTGNVSLAAKHLKIGQATLYRKIKQYGIRM